MKKKIVLTYSGGLNASVTVQWPINKGYDVVACYLSVGEGKDLDIVYEKVLGMGAVECHIIDTTKGFSDEYVSYAIKGSLIYENTYPLISALSRPLIAKKLVEIAEKTNSIGIVHGCTGKGNDQVRFEVAVKALSPSLKTFTPIREWAWSHEKEIDCAIKHNTPVSINHDSPYSVGQNLWGRTDECDILEDPYAAPPEDTFDLADALEETPDTADEIILAFDKGILVQIDGKIYELGDLILTLGALVGKHGIRRIDHVENRLVGIKSREIYKAPAAEAILEAHRALETITLTKDVAHSKSIIEKQSTGQLYSGLWFSPLIDSLKLFIDSTQQYVSGDIRIRLFKGNATVNDRKSPYTLYDEKLAAYTKEGAFNQDVAIGFIGIYGLPTQVNAMLYGGYSNEQ